jgi:hypothetical protein
VNPSNEHADSVFYGLAAEEIQAGNINKGLMAKAIAKASGDKVKAEVLYLEWRVELLKEEAVNEFKRQKADAKRRETEKREKRKADEELEKGDRLNKGCAVFFFVIGVVAIAILFIYSLTL